MKALGIFLVAALLSTTLMSTSFINSTTDTLELKLRNRIALLVDQPGLLLQGQALVKVMFQLNDLGEIVVIDVDTDNAKLDRFVKRRLNYESAGLDTYKSGLDYYIDLRFSNG